MALPRNGYTIAMAKVDLLSGAFVCRHKAGSWNAVSADQFGEQTAIKIGKGVLKGITLSPEQVAEWIDSFPISAYVSDALDHCYSPDQANSSSETPHKEEGIKRRKVDTDDRRLKLKHGIKIGDQAVFDLESIFLRLLLVGQQREMELLPIFGYELCAVPPSLVDEYGCLRKGNKTVLMHRLGVKQCQLQRPDVVIVDAQQLLYHVVWPCG